jgi:hypothetical protein
VFAQQQSFVVTIVGDKKRFAIRDDRMTKRHRFGGGRNFISNDAWQSRACQVGDHRLEVQEGLESTCASSAW